MLFGAIGRRRARSFNVIEVGRLALRFVRIKPLQLDTLFFLSGLVVADQVAVLAESFRVVTLVSVLAVPWFLFRVFVSGTFATLAALLLMLLPLLNSYLLGFFSEFIFGSDIVNFLSRLTWVIPIFFWSSVDRVIMQAY